MKNLYLLVLALGLAGSLHATVYTVTSTAPAGPGTLFDLVAGAVDGDVIQFDASTNGAIIIPAGPININAELLIRGNGCGQTIISGNGTQQIFVISGVAPAANTVRIFNLELNGGNAAAAGGAIQSLAGGLTTRGVCFNGNTVSGGAATDGGGAVHVLNAEYRVIDCQFTDNNAPLGAAGGGAIRTENARLVVRASTFLQNGAADRGGAILHESTEAMVVEDCQLFGNAAGGNGGAIYTDATVVVHVRASEFQANSAADSGGALFNRGFEARVRQSLFADNQAWAPAAPGGGGALANAVGELDLRNDVQVISNYTPGAGGGLLNLSGGVVRMEDTRFVNNEADDGGGGVADMSTSGSLFVKLSSFDSNGSSTDGGGIYVKENNLTRVTETQIGANTAAGSGGGVYVGLANARFEDCGLLQNQAFGLGGGGLFTGANPTRVVSCDISGNQATAAGGYGGGIYASPGADLRVTTGSSLSFNAADQGGGAVYLDAPGTNHLVADGELIANFTNGATSTGGAVMLAANTQATLTRNEITDNFAQRSGGGVYAADNSVVRVVGGTVGENTCAEAGGGIYVEDGEGYVIKATVRGNETTGSAIFSGGGGLYNRKGKLRVRQSSFYFNRAGGAGSGGGLLNHLGDDVILNTTTFSNNSSTGVGGGIYSEAEPLKMRNLTVTENAPDGMVGYGDARRCIVHDNFGTNVLPPGPWTGDYNLFDALPGGMPAANNITAPSANLLPLGPYAGTWSHEPDCASPANGNGGTTTGTDQNGQPVAGAFRDIGAHELVSGCSLLPDADLPTEDVGAPELERAAGVFPNPAPAGGTLTVRLPVGTEVADVSLLSPAGQVLSERQLTDGASVALPATLAPGVYWIRVVTEAEQTVHKVQITR